MVGPQPRYGLITSNPRHKWKPTCIIVTEGSILGGKGIMIL